MPKYTDPTTGKIISSDQALTSDELEEAFGAVGEKGTPEGKSVSDFVTNRLPASGLKFAQSLKDLILHPVETIKNISKIGAGGFEQAIESYSPAMAKRAEGSDRSDIEAFNKITAPIWESIQNPKGIPGRVANYAYNDPIQTALMVSGGMTGASKLADVAGADRISEIANKGAEWSNPLAAPINVAGKVASPVKNAIGRTITETLGTTTGSGRGAIQEAIKGSSDFTKAMRGDLSGEEVVENAKGALQTIRDKRANAYKSKLAEVSQNKEPIDLTPFKESVTEDLKKFVRYNEGETITTPPQKVFTAIPEKYPHSGQ